jgi:curved DNA-binding protein CbpA
MGPIAAEPFNAPRPEAPARASIAPPPLAKTVPVALGASGASGPPRPSSARRAEIERRASRLDTDDFYEVLGVAQGSTPDQVKTAYFGLAKSWHPDRLPPDLLDLKPVVARIFARFSEAYQTLSDPAAAAAYAESHRVGAAEREDQAKVARVVDAALEFQKAEILLKKNDLAGAEQLASHAFEADPEQPEYATLLTWIRAIRRGDPPELREGQTSTHFDDLIRILDGILAKEQRFERAAAEVNPKNLDAVREVRLYEMRKRAGSAAGATSKDKPAEGGQDGLFGKFFKR